MSPDPGRRRSIWLPDKLMDAVVEAAALETLGTGERVSVAEWVRRALRERLERYGDAS